MRSELALFARFCRGLTLENGRPLTLERFERTMLADYFDGALETLVLLPKKNGKTTLLAALALFHLLVTSDAECVIGATSRDQATILYDQACGFIRRSEQLLERLVIKRGYREIRNRRDSGRIRVLAADVDTADGVIPTLALVDELHRARSADLYGIFRDGLGPRGGRMITISSAGEHEASPLGEMRAAARRLPRRVKRDAYLYAKSQSGAYVLHEWSLEPDDDRADMRKVKRANPASWQTLRALQARHDSPSTTPSQWARFACGVWMAAEAWWIDADSWRACSSSETLEDGDEIALGFDGARTGDATALVACRISDGLVAPLAVWEPNGRNDWEVPGGEVDAAIEDAFDSFRVVRGYFDPPFWQSEIDAWSREFGEAVVLRYWTGRARMMAATERFRTDVAARRLAHVDDEPLTRHVLNARTRQARGGYYLAKVTPSSPDKIDLAVAAVLAYEARCDALADREEAEPALLLVF